MVSLMLSTRPAVRQSLKTTRAHIWQGSGTDVHALRILPFLARNHVISSAAAMIPKHAPVMAAVRSWDRCCGGSRGRASAAPCSATSRSAWLAAANKLARSEAAPPASCSTTTACGRGTTQVRGAAPALPCPGCAERACPAARSGMHCSSGVHEPHVTVGEACLVRALCGALQELSWA